MDGGAWWAAVHGIAKSWTRLSDFTFTFHFHALEKEMATHSSDLAWRIPRTEEPGGLQSIGLQNQTRLTQLSTHAQGFSFSSVLESPGGLVDKEPACSAGDLGSIPGLGRCPGEGNSYPLHYSGLESSKGVAKSRT